MGIGKGGYGIETVGGRPAPAEPDALSHLAGSDQVAVGIDEAGEDAGVVGELERTPVKAQRSAGRPDRTDDPPPLDLDCTWFYERNHGYAC